MLLNVFHFTAILTTFVLTLAGKLELAIISFCVALVLTTFALVGRKEKSRNDIAKSKKHQFDDGPSSKVTEVLISKTYGGRKEFEKYHQSAFSPDDIQIDNSLKKMDARSFPLIWCWIVLLLGLITWGSYNFAYHDEPYVPLSRVYEDIVSFSKKSEISSNKKYQGSNQNWSSNTPKVKPVVIPKPIAGPDPITTLEHIPIPDRPIKKETPKTVSREGAVYSWTDDKGVTHHTNMIPPGYSEKITTSPEIRSSYNSTPIKLLNGRPLIPISIRHNGRSIDFEIIIDTGSSTSIIPIEIANHLKPEFIRKTHSNVADGRRVEGKLMMVDSIIVGPKSVNNITVITGRVAGSKNTGLLGINFIKHHPFYMDIDKKQIHWK